jgi:hypothetical protein
MAGLNQRSSGVSSILASAVLGLYVLAAALLPLGHHDIVCHLKSTTHCSTCVVGSSAESPSHTTSLAGVGLDDAGSAFAAGRVPTSDQQAGAASGRAPPTL